MSKWPKVLLFTGTMAALSLPHNRKFSTEKEQLSSPTNMQDNAAKPKLKKIKPIVMQNLDTANDVSVDTPLVYFYQDSAAAEEHIQAVPTISANNTTKTIDTNENNKNYTVVEKIETSLLDGRSLEEYHEIATLKMQQLIDALFHSPMLHNKEVLKHIELFVLEDKVGKIGGWLIRSLGVVRLRKQADAMMLKKIKQDFSDGINEEAFKDNYNTPEAYFINGVVYQKMVKPMIDIVQSKDTKEREQFLLYLAEIRASIIKCEDLTKRMLADFGNAGFISTASDDKTKLEDVFKQLEEYAKQGLNQQQINEQILKVLGVDPNIIKITPEDWQKLDLLKIKGKSGMLDVRENNMSWVERGKTINHAKSMITI